MNIFTNDDYRRIQAWLKANAIKDSDFASSDSTIPDEDILVITQNLSTVPTNYKIKIKDLLNSSLGKVTIDKITVNAVTVNNRLTVDASKVRLDNEKGTTLQNVLDYFEENKLNRHTDDVFDGNLEIKSNLTVDENLSVNKSSSFHDSVNIDGDADITLNELTLSTSGEGTLYVNGSLTVQGEIEDVHNNNLNDVNSAAKNWKLEYLNPEADEPTVRAKYVLKDYKGVPKGDVVKVYKDSAITNVYLGTTDDTCNEDTGEVTKHEIKDNNEALSIVYRLDTGKYSLVNIPLGIFTREAEFDKYRGLGVTPNGQVFVKLANDEESTNYLHFNALGEISADGIESRVLRDLGTLLSSIAGDGTMWGEYKRHEGTQDTSTPNDGSRWGEFKRAEEIREQTSDSAHTVFSDNWDEQDDDPEDYDPLSVTEASYAYNWKSTEGTAEGNLEMLAKTAETNKLNIQTMNGIIGKISLPITGYNGYISTHWGPGTTISLEPTANPDFNYIIHPCAPGDTVIVNGTGGGSPRLWAFVDAEYKMIIRADESVSASDLRLVAPPSSALVIINDKSGSTSFYESIDSHNSRLISLKEELYERTMYDNYEILIPSLQKQSGYVYSHDLSGKVKFGDFSYHSVYNIEPDIQYKAKIFTYPGGNLYYYAVTDANDIVLYEISSGDLYIGDKEGSRVVVFPKFENQAKLYISEQGGTECYKLASRKNIVDKVKELDDAISPASQFFGAINFACDGDSLVKWPSSMLMKLPMKSSSDNSQGNAFCRDRTSDTSGNTYYPQWAPDCTPSNPFIDYKGLTDPNFAGGTSKYPSGTPEFDQATANNCLYGHLGRFIQMVRSGEFPTPHIFVMNMMGVNDLWSSTLGTTETRLGTFEEAISGSNDAIARNTILNAIRWFVTKFRQEYPECRLFWKTSTQQTADNHPYFYMVEEPLLKLLRYLSVPVIDSYAEVGIMRELEHFEQSERTNNQWTLDGTHPTEDGYKRDGEFVASKLKAWFSCYYG